MNRLAPSKLRFRFLAGGAILLASASLSMALPYAHLWRVRQAHKFGNQAQAAANPETAAAYWEAGLALSPNSQDLVVHLAKHYQKQRKLDAAARVWQGLPDEEGSDEAARALFMAGKAQAALDILPRNSKRAGESQIIALKALALCELGHLTQAAEMARQANSGSNDTITMLIAVHTLSNSQDVDYLRERLSSPEASERVLKLKLSKTALSAYFYANGLLNSAERALQSELGRSSEAHLLLGRILLAKGNNADAQMTLNAGIKLDPANIELHRLLERSYRRSGNTDGADQELGLIKRLEAGQP